MQKPQILTLLLFFLLTNCSWLNQKISPKFVRSSQIINHFPENKYGIAIFKFQSRYPSVKWCKFFYKTPSSKLDCFKVKPSDSYQIIMFEPGIYEISSYEETTRLYGSKNIKFEYYKNSKVRKTKPEIAFKIKSGKISFLGQIHYKSSHEPISEKQKIIQYEEIKNFLENQNLNALRDLFNSCKTEITIIANKLVKNKDFLAKNYVNSRILTKNDFDLLQYKKDIEKFNNGEKEKKYRKKLKKITKNTTKVKKPNKKFKSKYGY